MKPKLAWNLIMSFFYLFVLNLPLFAQQSKQIQLNRDLILLVIILLVALLYISIFKKNMIRKDIDKVLENRVKERTNDLYLIIDQLNIERNERKLAEQSLKNSEEKYKYLFERNPATMLIFEINTHKILAVNASFLKFYGYSEKEALNMKFPDLYPEEEKVLMIDDANKIHGLTFSTVRHHLKKDGSVISIIATSHDLDFMGNNARIVVVTDISDRMNAEEQVLKLNQTLEERVKERTSQLFASNNELEAYSYSISHDLRAPLRAIFGFSQILASRHREFLNEEGKQYMDYIVQASIRMEQLINDLLNYSKLGRKPFEIVPVSIGEIIDQMRTDFKQMLDEAGVEFIMDKEYPVIPGEENLLRQIFTNLIDNAIKYRRKDVQPWIKIHCEKDETGFIIKISDNGIGISQEYLDKIFLIFQRLHSETEYPGTGVGLANVRKAVTMLNGEIWVESLVGEGSTFILHFPELIKRV